MWLCSTHKKQQAGEAESTQETIEVCSSLLLQNLKFAQLILLYLCSQPPKQDEAQEIPASDISTELWHNEPHTELDMTHIVELGHWYLHHGKKHFHSRTLGCYGQASALKHSRSRKVVGFAIKARLSAVDADPRSSIDTLKCKNEHTPMFQDIRS